MYRIIHIEDLPSDAYLVRREVKKVLDPFDITIVEDKEGFTDALAETTPDIIISDISIPGFDWRSALVIVRERMLNIPFIVVSGSTGDDVRQNCLAAGATEFICKNDIQRLG